MAKRSLPLIMWAGFVDGKMHVEDTTGDYGTYKRPGIFMSKKRAQLEYQDVRRVKVTLASASTTGNRR